MSEVMRDERGRILPGYTANPLGRKPKEVELDYMRQLTNFIDQDKFNEITKKLYEMAVKRGNIKAIELLLKYIVGLPVQRTELSGVDGGSINIIGALAAIGRVYGVRDTDTDTDTDTD